MGCRLAAAADNKLQQIGPVVASVSCTLAEHYTLISGDYRSNRRK